MQSSSLNSVYVTANTRTLRRTRNRMDQIQNQQFSTSLTKRKTESKLLQTFKTNVKNVTENRSKLFANKKKIKTKQIKHKQISNPAHSMIQMHVCDGVCVSVCVHNVKKNQTKLDILFHIQVIWLIQFSKKKNQCQMHSGKSVFPLQNATKKRQQQQQQNHVKAPKQNGHISTY